MSYGYKMKRQSAMRREASIKDARTEELRFCTRFFAGRVSACTYFLDLVVHDLFVNIDIFRVFNDRFILILERTARRYAKPPPPNDPLLPPPPLQPLAMTCLCHREAISDAVNAQTFVDTTERIVLIKLLHITSLENQRVVRRCCVYESIFRLALIECFSDDAWRHSVVTMYDLRCELPSDLLNALIATFLVLGDQTRFWRTFFPRGDATMMAFLRQRASSLVPLVVDSVRWYTLLQGEQMDEEARVTAEAKAAMAAMATNMPPPKAKRVRPVKRVEFTADTNGDSDSDDDDTNNEAFSAAFSVGEEDSYAHRHNERLLVALYEHNYEIAEADAATPLDTYEVTLALYALAEWLSHAAPGGHSARRFYMAIHEALTIRRYENVVVDYESTHAPALFENIVVTATLAVAQWLLDQSSNDKQHHLDTLRRFTCDATRFEELVVFTEPLAWYERVRLLFAVTLNDVVTRRVRANVNAHLQMQGSARLSASRRDLFQHRTSAFRGRFKISQSNAFNDEVVALDYPDDSECVPDGADEVTIFSPHAALRLLRHARTVLQRDGDDVPRWLERVAVAATLEEATEWDRLYHFMYFDRNTMDPLELALSLEHLHRVYSVFSAPIQRSFGDMPSDMQPFSARESSTPSSNTHTAHEQHQHSRRYFSSHSYLPATLLSTNKYIFLVLYRQHSQVIQRGLVPYLTLHNRFVVHQHVPIYPHLVQSYLHISANNNSSVLGGADTLVWTMRTLTHFYMTSATRYTLMAGTLSNIYTTEDYTRHYQRLHRLLAAFAPTRQHIFYLLTQPYRQIETAFGNKQRGTFEHINLTQRFTPAHELDGFGEIAANFYTAFTAFARPELVHMMSNDTIQRICAGDQDVAFTRLFHERHPAAALVLDCMYVDGARAVKGGGRLRHNDYFTFVPMHGMPPCDEIGRRGSALFDRVLAEVADPLGALYEACCDAELFGDFTLTMFLSIRLLSNITFPSCKCHHVKKLRRLAKQNYKSATTAVYASEANANTYLPVIDGPMAKTQAHRTLDITPQGLDTLQYLFMALESLYYFPARVSYSELAAASVEDPLERDKTFAELTISRMRELTEQMRKLTRGAASHEEREIAKACTAEARSLRGDFADYLMQLGFENVMKAPETATTTVTMPLLPPVEPPAKPRNDTCSHKRRHKSFPLLDAYTETKKALSTTSSLFASFAATPVEERSRVASVVGTGGAATPTAVVTGDESPLHFTITSAVAPAPAQSQPLTQALLDSVFHHHGFGSDSAVACKHTTTTTTAAEPVFRGRLDAIEEWISLERLDRRPLCNYPVWAQGADFASQNEVFPVWFNLMGVNGARRAHTIDAASGLSMPFDGCNQDFLATLLMRPLTVVAVEPLAPLYARHFAREPLRLHAFTNVWRRHNAERRANQHGVAVSESERIAERQRARINAHLMAAQRWMVK